MSRASVIISHILNESVVVQYHSVPGKLPCTMFQGISVEIILQLPYKYTYYRMQFTFHWDELPCGPKLQVESKFQWVLSTLDCIVIEYILHVCMVCLIFLPFSLFSLPHLQSRIQAQPDKGMWTTFDVLCWNDGRLHQ